MNLMMAAMLFADGEAVLPRFRHVSDLTLDLFHHDGRIDDRWLGLQPDEFVRLWRLAKTPGKRLPHRLLLAGAHDHAVLERAMDQLGDKLTACGLGGILKRHNDSSYSLCAPSAPRLLL
jgi:DNA-binding response OmpR family regulator